MVLLIPTWSFPLNSVTKESKSYWQVKHKVERRSTQWLHCSLTVELYSLPAWLTTTTESLNLNLNHGTDFWPVLQLATHINHDFQIRKGWNNTKYEELTLNISLCTSCRISSCNFSLIPPGIFWFVNNKRLLF